tara:strand:+ start:60 stop:263 length:204 start_codon:yes stop_codon:yes gene_type:complete
MSFINFTDDEVSTGDSKNACRACGFSKSKCDCAEYDDPARAVQELREDMTESERLETGMRMRGEEDA